MTEPMRDTFARLADLRERATPGEWAGFELPHRGLNGPLYGIWKPPEGHIVAPMVADQPNADLIVAEHNSGPARDAMLREAREAFEEIKRLTRDTVYEAGGGTDYWLDAISDRCDAWLVKMNGEAR